MIRRSSDGFWRSTLLEAQGWLDHSFGTALAAPPGGFLSLKQVHSACVYNSSEWRTELEGDGLVSGEPGVGVAVKTADCVPLLLADPVRRVVAAIHAGWRGTVGDIAGAAVKHLAERYGSASGSLVAAIGPSIGLCCFEIGPDVAPQFRELFPERSDLDRQTRVDLREANVRLLRRAGVPEASIDWQGAPCTFCGGNEFHSWRRDRSAGLRMFSLIVPR